MDYDKLIDRLNTKLQSYASYTDSEFAHVIEDAALAIETLRAENERLRNEAEGMRSNWYKSVEKIKNLQADLARVTAERDGAISDLTYIARTYPVDLCDDLVCQYCKHYPNVNTGCPGWTDNDCFEWRGIKEG